MQARPERRILLRSPGDSVKETDLISVEGETVRVPLSSLRLRPRTEDFHQTIESPRLHLTKVGDNPCDLSRRYVSNRAQSRRAGTGEGHHYVSILPFGSDNKPEKVSPVPHSGGGVLRSHSEQPGHDIFSFGKEIEKVDFVVSRGLQQPCNVTKKPLFPDRKTMVNIPSSHTSSPSIEVPPTVLHRSTVTEDALRVDNQSVPGGDPGIKMVGRESGSPSGKANSLTSPRDDYLLGCSQNRGLGGCVTPGFYRGTMVRSRAGSEHQHTGVVGSRTGHKDIHEGTKAFINSYENRQHISPSLSSQHGGTKSLS